MILDPLGERQAPGNVNRAERFGKICPRLHQAGTEYRPVHACPLPQWFKIDWHVALRHEITPIARMHVFAAKV